MQEVAVKSIPCGDDAELRRCVEVRRAAIVPVQSKGVRAAFDPNEQGCHCIYCIALLLMPHVCVRLQGWQECTGKCQRLADATAASCSCIVATEPGKTVWIHCQCAAACEVERFDTLPSQALMVMLPRLFIRMQEVGILSGLNYDRHIVQFYGAYMPPGQDPMVLTEVRPLSAARTGLFVCTSAL